MNKDVISELTYHFSQPLPRTLEISSNGSETPRICTLGAALNTT